MSSAFKGLDNPSESGIVIELPTSAPVQGRVSGQLRYAPNSGLTLAITVVASDAIKLQDLGVPKVIHGQLSDGRHVTLCECFCTRAQTHMLDASVDLIVRANFMLIGSNISDMHSPLFNTVSVNMNCLESWCGTGITIHTGRTTLPDMLVAVQARPGTSLGFSPLNGGPSLVIDHDVTIKYNPLTEVVCKSAPRVGLITRNLFTLNESLSYVFRLQSFFSLLAGYLLTPNRICLSDSGATSDNQSTKWELFGAFEQGSETAKVQQKTNLLEFASVLHILPRLWSAYGDHYEAYCTPLELDAWAGVSRGLRLSDRFLVLTQALESLHRGRWGGTFVSPEDWATYVGILLPSILCACPPDLRQALSSRIKYGNELSLRRRLKEMARMLGEDLQSRVYSDISTFLDRAVDTRNYLTHYHDVDQDSVFEGPSIHYATTLLRYLLVAVVLKDIGVPDVDIERGLRMAEDLKWAQQQIREYLSMS